MVAQWITLCPCKHEIPHLKLHSRLSKTVPLSNGGGGGGLEGHTDLPALQPLPCPSRS